MSEDIWMSNDEVDHMHCQFQLSQSITFIDSFVVGVRKLQANWESGDLAEAVRELVALADEAEQKYPIDDEEEAEGETRA